MYNDPTSKRIDLYVDESGQDTKGKSFVVAGVVVEIVMNSASFVSHWKKPLARRNSNMDMPKEKSVWCIYVP